MASLARELKFDPARLFTPTGAEGNPRGAERDTDGNLKYRSPDKIAARERAMKHVGLYERDNKQKPFYVPPVIRIVAVPACLPQGQTYDVPAALAMKVIPVKGRG